MSIDIMSAVWKHGPCNSTERFVLLSIADRADEVGYCYPSYNDIAKRCAVSRPTVIKAINRLRDAGWIRTEAVFKKDGSRTSNGIFINLERLVMEELGSKESLPGVVKKRNRPSKESLPGVVKNQDGGSKESLPKSSSNHHIEPPIKPTTTPDEKTPAKEPAEEVVVGDPISVLADHFRTRTGIEPPDENSTMFRDNWQPVLSAILERVNGDMEQAKALINASVEFAWGRGTNKTNRTFPLASPHSLRTIWVNRAAELAAAESPALADEDEAVWQQAIATVSSGRPPEDNPPLLHAIKTVGWNAIAEADKFTESRLKRQLFNAYRSAPA